MRVSGGEAKGSGPGVKGADPGSRGSGPGGKGGDPGAGAGRAGGGSTRRPDLLPPEALALAGSFEFVARKVVEGALLGMHGSRRRGVSAEFAELRDYRQGDDLRLVDWRMLARSDRWYVREFHEDTHLSAMVLLDVSASMGWSSRPGVLPEKLWYGRVLAATLGLLLLGQGDRVGLVAFDEEVRRWLPPRGGRTHEARFLRELATQEAGGSTSAAAPLQEVALRLRRRGLVVLVSDLLVDPEPTARALRFLAHRGHQVVVAHLMDPGERELEGGGRARLRDPETGTHLTLEVPRVRDAYREAVNEALRGWGKALRPAGVEHHLVDTSRPLAHALARLSGKGAGGGRGTGGDARGGLGGGVGGSSGVEGRR